MGQNQLFCMAIDINMFSGAIWVVWVEPVLGAVQTKKTFRASLNIIYFSHTLEPLQQQQHSLTAAIQTPHVSNQTPSQNSHPNSP